MLHLIIPFVFTLFFTIPCNANYIDLNSEIEINTIIDTWFEETKAVEIYYDNLRLPIELEIYRIKNKLVTETSLEKKVDLLIEKDQLQNTLELNSLSKDSDISKIRYLKGLQIIKNLYEKALSLDHHFASVATFNEISNLTNPNHYPEFIKIKEVINSKQDKKRGFSLSGLLENNIYTSVVHSFSSLFNNTNKSKEEKEESLKDIECILDFTLRMHNDLNTIYFETAFLKKNNDNIIIELEQLFVDFTKPIKYNTSLKECRNSDDWDAVSEKLNNYIKTLNKIIKDDTQRYKVHKMQINLEFPIDRLLQFITQYNTHITQGAKFYEKFEIMLSSYENEQFCYTKIPVEYKTLKENIKTSIEKFNTAYKPIELNGSKMKQILYGINEYE